jgi:hypothetical protein
VYASYDRDRDGKRQHDKGRCQARSLAGESLVIRADVFREAVEQRPFEDTTIIDPDYADRPRV